MSILLLMFLPPVILIILGVIQSSKGNFKPAKKLYIAGVVYLLIGLGLCGIMLANFSLSGH